MLGLRFLCRVSQALVLPAGISDFPVLTPTAELSPSSLPAGALIKGQAPSLLARPFKAASWQTN